MTLGRQKVYWVKSYEKSKMQSKWNSMSSHLAQGAINAIEKITMRRMYTFIVCCRNILTVPRSRQVKVVLPHPNQSLKTFRKRGDAWQCSLEMLIENFKLLKFNCTIFLYRKYSVVQPELVWFIWPREVCSREGDATAKRPDETITPPL